MDEKHLSFCHAWFEAYVDDFHSPEREIQESIDLKIGHTFRVCENITRISRSLHLDLEKERLAEAIALFHDVGRFEQLRLHKTFSDKVSLDHAALGISLLEGSAPLKGLTKKERHIFRRAIWHHNKYEITEDEGSDVLLSDILLFSRLIRDADKLDIFRVITDYFSNRKQQPNSALEFGLSEGAGFSREAVDDILNNRMVKIDNLGNLNDMRLMYLSWAFDLNFPVTVSCVLEEPYLDILMDSLPENGDMQRVRDRIRGHLEDRRRIQI